MVLRWLILAATAGRFIKPDPPGIAGEAGAGDDADLTGDGGPPRANYVFFTSGTFTPNTPQTNLMRADAMCNLAAMQAMPQRYGHYVAWLSGNGVGEAAIDRLRAHHPRGWKLVNGELFADTVDDLANGILLGALHLDENGVDIAPGTNLVQVATGSDQHGGDIIGADVACSQGKIEIGDPRLRFQVDHRR